MSLTELTNELSKSFDACLESILADPQQKEDDAESMDCCLERVYQHLILVLGLDTQLAALKSSFLQIENQLRDIRLKALGSKELSVTEVRR